MMELLRSWAPILIPLLGLLAGTGWLQYYLNQRRATQKDFKTQVEDFLLPLQGTLKVTKRGFDKLRDDRELSNLEYHPSRLQQSFAALPEEDPRKHLWRAHIESLQAENRRAVDLIQRFYGRILLPDFRQACDEFVIHAKEWDLVWKALIDGGTVPGSLDSSGSLFAAQFPKGFETELQNELREVKKHAGI